jgi:hypothetical protein
MMRDRKVTYMIILGVFVISLGCSFSDFHINSVDVGEMQYESKTVELGDADEVQVDIRMGAGQLNIDNRAESLMEADFTYNIESWAPQISYSVEDNQGRLTVRQPQTNDISVNGNMKYEWNLRFARDIPMKMRIDCGASDHDLDLAELSITSLDVKIGAGNVKFNLTKNPELQDVEFNIGAGNVDIDLDGVWEQDVDIAIQGGVGRILLRLPQDTGVRVEVSKGVANVESDGLSRNGNTYTNNFTV